MAQHEHEHQFPVTRWKSTSLRPRTILFSSFHDRLSFRGRRISFNIAQEHFDRSRAPLGYTIPSPPCPLASKSSHSSITVSCTRSKFEWRYIDNTLKDGLTHCARGLHAIIPSAGCATTGEANWLSSEVDGGRTPPLSPAHHIILRRRLVDSLVGCGRDTRQLGNQTKDLSPSTMGIRRTGAGSGA